MMDKDFKYIKPIKTYDEYWNRDCFIVPCNILDVGRNIDENKRVALIERLDFTTGEFIKHHAIVYKKTVEIFENLNLNVPIRTNCKIIKNVYKNGLNFIIYGYYNTPAILHKLFDETFSGDNDQEIFINNYSELNHWRK